MGGRGEHVEGERQQCVAGQDGRAGAERRPHRRAVPALAVEHVGVQQGEVVHQLNRDGRRDRRRHGRHGRHADRGAADRFRGQQGQRRAQCLAARTRLILAVAVPPPEVEADGAPGGRGQPVDRRPQRRLRGCPRPLEDPGPTARCRDRGPVPQGDSHVCTVQSVQVRLRRLVRT
jgi:hypothetical protein